MPFSSTFAPGYLLTAWKENIIKVRSLFSARKYRRCVILCEELLEQAECPTQRTFVLFYQALSYEALGLIAHKYSSNKIPLLEQARDAFFAAAEEVRLLAKTNIIDRQNRLTGSASLDFEFLPPLSVSNSLLSSSAVSPSSAYEEDAQYATKVTNAGQDPLAVVNSTCSKSGHFIPRTSLLDSPPPAVSSGVEYDAQSQQSPTTSINDETSFAALSRPSPSRSDIFEPHRPSLYHELGGDLDDVGEFTPIACNMKSPSIRLSQALSPNHILASDLVPIPLFSRNSTTTSFAEDSVAAFRSKGGYEKPLPVTPINRPLPPLPFNHQHNFEIRGNRIFQIPKQNVGLQKLVSKYESSPKRYENRNSPSKLGIKTPTSERFRMISACFEEKKQNQGNSFANVNTSTLPVNTPCPGRPRPLPPTPRLPAQNPVRMRSSIEPPSIDTTNYTAALTAFQASLKTHLIPSITNTITQARKIQLDHEYERRTRFQQSRCSAISASVSSGQAQGVRMASFWSFKAAVAHAEEESEEAVKKRELRERIVKLKGDGWKSVRAEAKGFKGVEYYAGLRAEVEREMGGYGFDGGYGENALDGANEGAEDVDESIGDGPGPAVLECYV